MATATSFDKRSYEPIDDIDKVSCRPDFAVPVYSGYLKSETKDELAAGLRVPVDTPPVFLAHGSADPVSPPEHSVIMYLALRRAGVPTELHVYPGAVHGFMGFIGTNLAIQLRTDMLRVLRRYFMA
jgi:acetyl esterase/lipase